MPVGSYRFHTGVSAFFEMATSDARAVLPEHLEPIEVRHPGRQEWVKLYRGGDIPRGGSVRTGPHQVCELELPDDFPTPHHIILRLGGWAPHTAAPQSAARFLISS